MVSPSGNRNRGGLAKWEVSWELWRCGLVFILCRSGEVPAVDWG